VTVRSSSITANRAAVSSHDHAPVGDGCYVFRGGVLDIGSSAITDNR